jgi:hypothetical protein
VEYFSLFFLGFQAYQENPNIRNIIRVLAVTFLLVLLYGIGQKFFGLPAFLTMNEEFAKGIPLRLPSTARIPSTFGGHYDFAAYLVFMIPIMGSLVFGMPRRVGKIIFLILATSGLLLLLFTASRVSFGVYLVAISVMLVWQRKWLLILPVILASILILNLTSGASERFYKTFRVSSVVVDLSTGRPIGTLEKLEGQSAVLEQIERPDEETLPKGSGFINIPVSGTEIAMDGQSVKKVEYFKSEALTKGVGDVATISGSFLIQKALVYDISITTRLQGQWPKAVEAFKRNILLGSGFSSLSLAADGDYLRMLGETGLLGSISFLGIIAAAFWYFFKASKFSNSVEQSFVIGVFAGIVGLMLNAVLIDVFEASKVAFTFWLVLGFSLSMLVRRHTLRLRYWDLLKNIFTHNIAFYMYLVILVFILWGGSLSVYFTGDDFTWTRWAAESKISDIFQIFSNSQGFFYRPIPKLWYFFLFSVFWLKPFMYHVASLVLTSFVVCAIYMLLKLSGVRKFVAWTSSAVFALLAIHHENIIWISGQSSLLSAVFLLCSILSKVQSGKSPRTSKYWMAVHLITLFCSMLSYDGMVIAPIALWIFYGLTLGEWKDYASVLALIPLYLGIRTYAGAVPPSGDYGYKLKTVSVNIAGNTIGYGGGIFIGPKALEMTETVRGFLRSEIVLASACAGTALVGMGFILHKAREKLLSYRLPLAYFAAALVLFLPYTGLGSTAERYAFIPSIFVVLGLGVACDRWLKNRNLFGKAAVFVCAGLLVWWNVREIERLTNDWQKAGKITEQTLLILKNETFPPKDTKTFFFIDTPIRFGRAWIFPTGLTDAIWHMYRESPFRVFNVPSIVDAYAYPVTKGDREVFVFDGYTVRRGIRVEEILNEGSGL